MATEAADGKFTMMWSRPVAPRSTVICSRRAATCKDTYLYPPAALAASTDQATCLMLTPGVFDTVATLAQAEAGSRMGRIGVLVVDGANMPIAGAKITSSPPGMVRYNGMSGRPDPDAMETPADGIGYIFNVPAGTVTVSATKSGVTFAPKTT